MKYSTFNEILNTTGYQVDYFSGRITVTKESEMVATISKNQMWQFSTFNFGFDDLTEEERKELVFHISKISGTPPKDREDEKKYRLKFIGKVDDKSSYLNINDEGFKVFGSYHDLRFKKSIFTESELQDIDETGFVREEV